ncbi:hypothetical protein [Capsulimonas corticalis]|uniref:hypothetical protein n=1 Tax=Capsulimonas corticalis TaxID=2219043 RepID=UPI0026138FC8|nr:hypothetical protein [Capsulimonas corticalis]
MSETPWDFRPFCSSEGLEDVRVVLIFDEQYGYYALGAIGFRRIFHKSKPYWILNWAWFHPFIRGKSRLVKLWPALMQRFGKNFLVEFPVSHSMQAVLKKTGHMKRMNAFARSFEQSN